MVLCSAWLPAMQKRSAHGAHWGQAGCRAPALGSMDAARNLLPVPTPSSQLKHAVSRPLKCCSWWVQRARLNRG